MTTPLRQRMLEELQRRNYSSKTIRLYLRHVAEFAKHFHRSPDQLGAEDIRQYQLFLIQEKKLAWSSYNQIVCALRFFYAKTLKRAFLLQEIPFPTDGTATTHDSQPGGGGKNPHRASAPQDSRPADDHLRGRFAAFRGGPLASERHRLGAYDHHGPSRQRAKGSTSHVVSRFAADPAAVLATQQTQAMAFPRRKP
jgi:Phage integrase, N-terminal SAM-like domain